MWKLVRDRIPEIIRDEGKAATVSTIEDGYWGYWLERKLEEESWELRDTLYLGGNLGKDENLIEEAADVLEIIHAILRLRGLKMEDVEERRRKKAEEKGGFNEGYLLWTEP